MRQFSSRSAHDIESGAAVHVNVDEAGRENGIGKITGEIDLGDIRRNFAPSARGKFGDEAVLNKDERMLYLFLRSVKALRAEHDHIASKKEFCFGWVKKT